MAVMRMAEGKRARPDGLAGAVFCSPLVHQSGAVCVGGRHAMPMGGFAVGTPPLATYTYEWTNDKQVCLAG
jgi:hypothetical protein